jgi:asparagine synthase (glutamine-hydrolysing)
MSGICGLLRRDGAAAGDAALAAMTRALARRGPDGAGIFRRGPVGLGHRRLLTLPAPDLPPQPLTLGTISITADARIDDRESLAAAIGNGAAASQPDVVLLVRAYQKWGEECLRHLVGDFAFALWDEARQILFCARDRFGARPFLYAATDDLFAFGSDAHPLIALPEVSRAPNEARIADYLVDGCLEAVDLTSTFYRGIFRLPPSSALTVSRRGLAIARYWSPGMTAGRWRASEREHVEAFRAAFGAAVRARLRGAPRVGAMLSGGLDSSSIVAVAAAGSSGRLPTFSAVDEDHVPCAESAHIRRLVALPGLAPQLIRPADVAALGATLDELVEGTDDPFVANILDVQWLMYRAAAGAGLSVLIDGVDGDLVIGKSGRLRQAIVTGRWWKAWQELDGRARWSGQSRRRVTWEEVLRPALGALRRNAVRALGAQAAGTRTVGPTADTTFIAPDFAARIGLAERLTEARHRLFLARAPSPDEEHARILQLPLLAVALERYDRLAAWQSIEPRHPFLDSRVVDLCLAIPWDAPVHDGMPKALLRRAMRGLLPETIRQRGWSRPLHRRVRQVLYSTNREFFLRHIEAGAADLAQYVDLQALQRRTRTGASSYDDVGEQSLARLAILASWLARQRTPRTTDRQGSGGDQWLTTSDQARSVSGTG